MPPGRRDATAHTHLGPFLMEFPNSGISWDGSDISTASTATPGPSSQSLVPGTGFIWCPAYKADLTLEEVLLPPTTNVVSLPYLLELLPNPGPKREMVPPSVTNSALQSI